MRYVQDDVIEPEVLTFGLVLRANGIGEERSVVNRHEKWTTFPSCPEVKIMMTGTRSEDPPEWSRKDDILLLVS